MGFMVTEAIASTRVWLFIGCGASEHEGLQWPKERLWFNDEKGYGGFISRMREAKTSSCNYKAG